MTEGVIIAIIGGVVAIITGGIGIIVVIIKDRLEKVEKKVDGRLTELLEITKSAHEHIGKLAGLKEGREDAIKEQAAVAVALASVPVVIPVPVVGQTDVLDKIVKIEENTKAIAQNTIPKTKPKTE